MPRRITTPGDLANTPAAEARTSYGGPTPPIDIYRCRIARIKYKKNRNNDMFYEVLLVIAHDENEPKSKFNGYVRSWNGNFTQQGMPYLRQFADAAGFSPRATMAPTIDDDGETVLKLGNTVIGGQMVRVAFKNGKPYNGKRTLDAGSFFEDAPDNKKPLAVVAEDDDSFDDDGDDLGSDDYGDESETAGADDDDSFEDESEGFDESGMDEFAEDDAPAVLSPKKAPAKRAPAKAAGGRKPF